MCIIELQSSEHPKKQLGSFDRSLKRKTCVEVIRLKLLVVFGLLVAALVEHTHMFLLKLDIWLLPSVGSPRYTLDLQSA